MNQIAIRVEKLGKQYRIGQSERYKALRDTLTDVIYTPFRAAASLVRGRMPGNGNSQSERTIWALWDVSFEVQHGEILGIIGRNGAGKSTLLKLLSRITAPTEGSIDIYGRVGSLLEVGTGFHPELTGRENIYLNGAILGMKRAEIIRKFDEIVGFAEIEKFIDTPVKFYSSGMYMRLAFSVAAHLDPEILLVDEVLAVGDAAFQKKCLGKMGEVARGGRTILFVSHNIAAIQNLCKRSLLLEGGRVSQDGPSSKVVLHYLSGGGHADYSLQPDHLLRYRKPSGCARIVFFRIDLPTQSDVSAVQTGMDIDLVFGCQGDGAEKDAICSFVIQDSLGNNLLLQHNKLERTDIRLSGELSEIICRIKNFPLPAGNYQIYVQLWIEGSLVDEANTDMFLVEAGDFFGTGLVVNSQNALFLTRATWFQSKASNTG